MKKMKFSVAIFIATFLSASAFAAAPVTDVTASKSNKSLEKQLQDLTRLLETRNKMQQRLQNRLDQLSIEMSAMQGSIE